MTFNIDGFEDNADEIIEDYHPDRPQSNKVNIGEAN
jgi:hypothetical protein